MCTLYQLIQLVLEIYKWILFAYVVFGLLISFGVINPYNQFVNVVYEVLQRLTEPLLKPLRNILPDTRPLDLSPLLLFILIWVVQSLLAEYALRPMCLG
jgi:YggT family protein